MNELAIRVSGVGKRYVRGTIRTASTLRDTVVQAIAAPFRRLAGPREESSEAIWALRDVSFEIRRGEVVGIIGRNGAGKSSLLKILAGITPPTEGTVELFGRVGALLEIGTGFEPELTGRENVFLNGAILGMKRREIQERFDAIVAFAEIASFIDTPVKHYSSGMYTRLAFAVAAHLDPEILVVDEVLAVGDAHFQKKCLAKMENVGGGGRTVIFVSHDIHAVTRLCSRAILLESGRVARAGPTTEVMAHYLRSDLGTSAARKWAEPPGDDIVRLNAVRACDEGGAVRASFDIRKPVDIEVDWTAVVGGHVLVPNLHFFNGEGTCLFVSAEVESEWSRRPRPPGRYTSTARIPGNFLAEGSVVVSVAVSTLSPVRVHVHEPDAIAFQIVDTLEGGSARGEYAGRIPGAVRPVLPWRTRVGDAEASTNPDAAARRADPTSDGRR